MWHTLDVNGWMLLGFELDVKVKSELLSCCCVEEEVWVEVEEVKPFVVLEGIFGRPLLTRGRKHKMKEGRSGNLETAVGRVASCLCLP